MTSKALSLASLSPGILEAAVAKFLSYNAESRWTLFEDFSGDNAICSSFNLIKWLSVYVDLDGHKIITAVTGSGAGRALGLIRLRF